MSDFRKTGAQIFDFEARVMNRAKVQKMPCGIELYHIPGSTMNVVKIDFIFDAGLIHETDKLVPAHCLEQLREGSAQYNASFIAELLDYHAVFPEPFISRNKAGIGFYMDLKSANKVLPVIVDFLFAPSFPQHEFEIFLQNTFQQLKIEYEKVKVLAGKRLSTMIYGNQHPLGANVMPEDVFRVSRNQLCNFHRNHYHAPNFKIIVSGDAGEELFRDIDFALRRYMADEMAEPIAPIHSLTPLEQNFEYIAKQGATQAAIKMGALFDFDNMQEYHLLKVLNTLLGGYFGSRLMKNIREDKGLTYGIGSSVQLSENKALFTISAEVSGNQWQQALDEINKELMNLSSLPISNDELNLVKKTMLGERLAMFDGAFASSYVLKSLIESGLDYNFVEEGIAAIHQANEYSLKILAEKMLKPGSLKVVVAGPK